MMDRKYYGIIVFPSSQAAAQAEIKLSEQELECRLIPLPPQISAGCGLVLQFSLQDSERIEAALEKRHLVYEGIYEVKVGKNRQKSIKSWKKRGEEI